MEKSDRHCLITGKAGTGKSTLLLLFREQTKKRVAVLSPTGVAAVNIAGQTIHSFFGFRPDITVEKAVQSAKKVIKQKREELYQELSALVVDEISMVRADLFHCMDVFLRTVRKKKSVPFGGVQMILFGDLYQLPPVMRSQEREIFASMYPGIYFFDAPVLREMKLEMVELEKVYRQKDGEFIRLLNAVRNNTVTPEDLALFNRRCIPDFSAHGSVYVTLTTTNDMARQINDRELASLRGRSRIYRSEVSGHFDRSSFPTDETLELKTGAQVMLLNNDSEGRWINGTMGKVTALERDFVSVQLEDGSKWEVGPYKWDLYHYEFDAKTGSLNTVTAGSFTQIPLRLAWAVTIHKSQGKTFDHVVVDMGRGAFATGQTYVALSRCRTLEGLVLRQPLKNSHVRVDYRIMKFMTGHQYAVSETAMPLEAKFSFLEEAIRAKASLEMVYLKREDEKTRRRIRPLEVGEMEYSGKTFPGLRAFCEERHEERTFRVDRILEMKRVT